MQIYNLGFGSPAPNCPWKQHWTGHLYYDWSQHFMSIARHK